MNSATNYLSVEVTLPCGEVSFDDSYKAEAANEDIALKWALLEHDDNATQW